MTADDPQGQTRADAAGEDTGSDDLKGVEKPGPGRWGDLAQRLLSGGIAAVSGLWLMWIGGIPFKFLIATIVGLMIWEVARMIGWCPACSAAWRSVWVGNGGPCATYPPGFALPLLLPARHLGVALLDRHKVSFTIFSASAILIAGFGLFALRDDFGFRLDGVAGACRDHLRIFWDILQAAIIGGPKFWPKVSPKKTWSGTLAGWVGAALIGGLPFVLAGHASVELIGISIAISMASPNGRRGRKRVETTDGCQGQFGDLAGSWRYVRPF